MKLIILEGIDGSGKSSLRIPVSGLSNYADLVLDRFTPTAWVYGHYWERPQRTYEVINEQLQGIFDVHVVWLRVTPELAHARKPDSGGVEFLRETDRLYERYFKNVCQFRHIHEVEADWKLPNVLEQIRLAVYEGRQVTGYDGLILGKSDD